jgi:hypothetical protein
MVALIAQQEDRHFIKQLGGVAVRCGGKKTQLEEWAAQDE